MRPHERTGGIVPPGPSGQVNPRAASLPVLRRQYTYSVVNEKLLPVIVGGFTPKPLSEAKALLAPIEFKSPVTNCLRRPKGLCPFEIPTREPRSLDPYWFLFSKLIFKAIEEIRPVFDLDHTTQMGGVEGLVPHLFFVFCFGHTPLKSPVIKGVSPL